MRRIVSSLILGLFAASLVHPVLAQDAAAGETKAATCAACHGPSGNSINPAWPNLAGQHAGYVQRQLALFKDGGRQDPLMSGMAMALSDQDMADLSAYFASQNGSLGVADGTLAELARRIYLGGDKQRAVPACIACHGPGGQGNPGAGYPVLAGQHAVYTQKVLTEFKAGNAWGSEPLGSMMVDIAGRLTDDEIIALASYFQGLTGG